jgi:hypothetical protein
VLIVARNESFLFRTGLACAAVVYASGVISVIGQHNTVGVVMIVAPVFFMLALTSLLPREARPIATGVEADRPFQVLDAARMRRWVGRARPVLRLASYAVAALVVAFASNTARDAMIVRPAHEAKGALAAYRPSPYQDLSGTMLRASELSGEGAGQDDEAESSMEDALEATGERSATPDLGLKLPSTSVPRCLSPLDALTERPGCDTAQDN